MPSLVSLLSAPPHLIALAICALIITTCALTRVLTSLLFYYAVRRNRLDHAGPKRPPVLPYTIPFLGHALTFLNKTPRSFYISLQRKLTANDITFCTVLLAGDRAHIVNSANAVQVLLRNKHCGRHLNQQIGTGGLGASARDTAIMFPLPGEHESGQSLEEINHEYLLSQNAVTGLTDKFVEFFRSGLESQNIQDEWVEVDLMEFLREIMFKAAVSVVLGTKIQEMNPRLLDQYQLFDKGMIPRTIGLPRFLDPGAYRSAQEMTSSTEKYIRHALKECSGDLPEEPEWEPRFGSKFNRERHRYYQREGVSLHGQAAFDNGVLFGLNSNSLPITSWLMSHLLSPSTPGHVLDQVLTEIDEVRKPDGRIDISALKSKPLINSALEETLRKYVDALITRKLYKDIVVDGYLLRAGELVMLPSALAHYDPDFWEAPEAAAPAETWDAERFIRYDPATGNKICSTSWAAGRLIPWGGGKEMCPGRVFAKQELLASVATIFLTFDVEFVEFLATDENGKAYSRGKGEVGFPRPKKQYAGNGALKGDGDLRVKLRRRSR